MPPPILNVSLEEIRQETARLVEWLENASMRHSWAPAMLTLGREFQTLALSQPLDSARIREFTQRLRQHITAERLKGLDDVVWHSEALERLASR